MKLSPIAVAVCLTLAVAVLSPAAAQQAAGPVPGQARADMKPVGTPELPEALRGSEPNPVFIDYREEMRRFVQAISTFARSQRKDFPIIVQNGLELLQKVEGQEESAPRLAPARAYQHSIDGLLVEGLHHGYKQVDKPMAPLRRQMSLNLVRQAQKARLKILSVDYAIDSLNIDDAYQQALASGYTPFVAPARGLDLNLLPRYPKLPIQENADHILSLRAVRNFAWLMDTAPFGTEAEFALKMHQNNYDMLIVGVFHGRDPLSKQAVETLKYKKLGSRRQVFTRVDLGQAAAYDYFWKPEWKEGSPAWISAPVPGNPDRHWVEYWRPEWQKIIFGDPASFVQGVIAQGYDGIILDGVEAYRFFEGPSKKEQELDEETAVPPPAEPQAPTPPAAPAPAPSAAPPAPTPPPKAPGPLILAPAAEGLPK